MILTDDLRAIAEEIVRGGFLERVHIGLDFFDASINRVAAWVDRHAGHAQGPADCAVGADRKLRKLERRRLYLPAGSD